MMPDINSWMGVPGYGSSHNKTSNPQQFNNERMVTKMYPANDIHANNTLFFN